jgi:hypothetical protein
MPEPLWDYFSCPERTAFVLLFISNQLLNYLFLFINHTEVTLFSFVNLISRLSFKDLYIYFCAKMIICKKTIKIARFPLFPKNHSISILSLELLDLKCCYFPF